MISQSFIAVICAKSTAKIMWKKLVKMILCGRYVIDVGVINWSLDKDEIVSPLDYFAGAEVIKINFLKWYF